MILCAKPGKELTPADWDTETAGKTVFIKFLAPWCPWVWFGREDAWRCAAQERRTLSPPVARLLSMLAWTANIRDKV